MCNLPQPPATCSERCRPKDFEYGRVSYWFQWLTRPYSRFSARQFFHPFPHSLLPLPSLPRVPSIWLDARWVGQLIYSLFSHFVPFPAAPALPASPSSSYLARPPSTPSPTPSTHSPATTSTHFTPRTLKTLLWTSGTLRSGIGVWGGL